MGFIPEMPNEAGEYSVEVRRESFHLVGEEPDVTQPRPRHAIILYPHVLPPARPAPKPLSADAITIAIYALDEAIRSGRVDDERGPRIAWQMIKDELGRARAAEEGADRAIRTGMVEILIEDIPKIRACLDVVEAQR